MKSPLNTMQSYLKDKLVKVNGNIENSKASIIREVSENKFDKLISLNNSINNSIAIRKGLVEDAVKYLTVAELLEINENEDIFNRPRTPLFNEAEMAYAYKYNDKAITIQDRELLVSKFGYRLREAKV